VRALLTPIGSAGDTLPFIGLGRELAVRGHDVTIAASEPFAGLIRDSGLDFICTATEEEYHAATDHPDLFHPLKGFAAVMERVAEYNRRLFEIVTAHDARAGAVVIAHSLDFASRAIAEKTGLRVVRVHLQPSILRTSFELPVTYGTFDWSFLPRWTKRGLWRIVDRVLMDPATAPSVNELRARLGLAPVDRIFASQIDSPLLTVALFPTWFAPRQPDWPSNLVQCDFPLFDGTDSRGLPPDAERFLDEGEAPVVFTPGSAMRYGHRFFEAAVGACSRVGLRGALLTRHPEQVPARLPKGVERFDYVPLGALLPRSRALVHHGGIGTTAAALAAGVPQVIVPFSHDQPDNAARVVRLGVGARVLPRRLDTAHLADVLRNLLGADDAARRCREVAGRMSGRGIAQACDVIESALGAEFPPLKASSGAS
jgi:UDP:flavonoid glycosyltransferase YjiC (YdhE family)